MHKQLTFISVVYKSPVWSSASFGASSDENVFEKPLLTMFNPSLYRGGGGEANSPPGSFLLQFKNDWG